MATAKIATLIIRTLAKPISIRIKEQARQHDRFRGICIELAQFMYRTEVRLRTNILGEPAQAKHIRPLSEAKAIENGANSLAEGFLFLVAASLIVGETWRSSRKEGKRREGVDDQLDELAKKVETLGEKIENITGRWDEERAEEKARNDELARILERVVEIGLRGGWAEFQDSPIQIPRVDLVHGQLSSSNSSSSSNEESSTSTQTSVLASIPNISDTFRTRSTSSSDPDVDSSHTSPSSERSEP